MKKILIGTTNPSKVKRFEAMLADYDAAFCTLSDLGITEEPEEQGATPEENAVLKAAFMIPRRKISCWANTGND